MTDEECGEYLAELMSMLKLTDYLPVSTHGEVLPIGAHVWPVQGKSLTTLWTKKGVDLKRPVTIVLATKLPAFCAKKMSYFYDKPDYAMLWFKEPIPLGSSQMTYGMVYQPKQAWTKTVFQVAEGPAVRPWTH